LIPRVGLSELFVEPAVRFINAHGGAVQTGVCVEKLQLQGSRIHSVRTSDGRKLHVHSVVSAVPWYSYEEIMKASSDRADRVISPRQKNTVQNQFHSSPIISIHLWLDRKITDIDFAAVLETRIQWIFNKSTLLKSNRAGRSVGQYLSLVISGAQEFIGLNKKQLVELAIEDLRRVLPEAQNARVVHALVIKEKRATFLPSPGLDSLRPTARTQYDNLFLAGDWTATGLPATIESAVMSGRTVAKLIEQEPHH
jgi:zeta-carotene desaturase